SKSNDSPSKKSTADSEVSFPGDYKPNAIKGKAAFSRDMGLKNLDLANWLIVDDNYTTYLHIRFNLLNNHKDEVLQIVHTPTVQTASEELLRMVSDFLIKRYPSYYGTFTPARGRPSIMLKRMDTTSFDITPPFAIHPLEICARLAMEDFNILIQDESTGEHHLAASVTLFPVGWKLKDRIGWSITKLHAQVPEWSTRLSHPVEKFFSRIRVDNPMERSAYFIQIAPPTQTLQSTLFSQETHSFHTRGEEDFKIEDVIVRMERQTFRRLPISGAIVFTVKTVSKRLMTDFEEEELANLALEIRGWPEEVGRYKGRDGWGEKVLKWVDLRTGNYYDEPWEA
ncbi:hypothetical protein EJ08DRAFT_724637, partial [Tothia fuscella]